ncbi:MAG: ShlB/FhaC/HecB family hemolysin secretion/activation protein [Proteobacteria bacterium]|nr:ShlB/FhaC/HecB family hemolysin secretion/activation protein [Pseudomonadota bacterium]
MLDTRSVEEAVYPYVGPDKQISDIESARAALERVYHDRGFGTVFVDIPEQSIEDGIVRLHVTEGELRQVRVVGARYFSGRQIKAALPAAQEGAVPNLPELQREVNQLNAQTRDRVIVPVLKAGPQPGTVDVQLKTEDHSPFHGSVELNNQYTVDTTHLRAAAALSYDNMFGRLDSLALQYQLAPEAPHESHVIAGSYTFRLGSDGSSLAFQYLNSKSDVATVGTLGVVGTGVVYGVRYLQPLTTKSVIQDFALEVDYKDYKQSILVSATNGLNTPVDYMSAAASYTVAQYTTHHQADLTVTANFGLRGITGQEQQFADKRYGAVANYFYLRGDGGYTLALPRAFSVALRLTGQYSPDPLISNEQLPLGGVATVRGYLEAEELADSALRGSLQFNLPPLNFSANRLHLHEFVFIDAARAFTLEPLPGQASHADLRSWGAGINFDAFSHFNGALTWADALAKGSVTRDGGSTLLFDVKGYW